MKNGRKIGGKMSENVEDKMMGNNGRKFGGKRSRKKFLESSEKTKLQDFCKKEREKKHLIKIQKKCQLFVDEQAHI
jgi:hypothetical protein